jgi:hypothetical protein
MDRFTRLLLAAIAGLAGCSFTAGCQLGAQYPLGGLYESAVTTPRLSHCPGSHDARGALAGHAGRHRLPEALTPPTSLCVDSAASPQLHPVPTRPVFGPRLDARMAPGVEQMPLGPLEMPAPTPLPEPSPTAPTPSPDQQGQLPGPRSNLSLRSTVNLLR